MGCYMKVWKVERSIWVGWKREKKSCFLPWFFYLLVFHLVSSREVHEIDGGKKKGWGGIEADE